MDNGIFNSGALVTPPVVPAVLSAGTQPTAIRSAGVEPTEPGAWPIPQNWRCCLIKPETLTDIKLAAR